MATSSAVSPLPQAPKQSATLMLPVVYLAQAWSYPYDND